MLKIVLPILLSSSLAYGVSESQAFNLEVEGDQVCKTQKDIKECLPKANYSILLGELEQPIPVANFDLLKAAKAESQRREQSEAAMKTLDLSESASSLDELLKAMIQTKANHAIATQMMDDNQLQFITDNFAILDVRNIALPTLTVENMQEHINPETGRLEVPMYFDLTYKSGISPQVTLHVATHWEVEIESEVNYLDNLSWNVEAFSDTNTQSKNDKVRFLESIVRRMIFSGFDNVEVVGGGDFDAKTLQFLEEVVTPMVIHEVVAVPMAAQIALVLPEVFGQIFEQMLD